MESVEVRWKVDGRSVEEPWKVLSGRGVSSHARVERRDASDEAAARVEIWADLRGERASSGELRRAQARSCELMRAQLSSGELTCASLFAKLRPRRHLKVSEGIRRTPNASHLRRALGEAVLGARSVALVPVGWKAVEGRGKSVEGRERPWQVSGRPWKAVASQSKAVASRRKANGRSSEMLGDAGRLLEMI